MKRLSLSDRMLYFVLLSLLLWLVLYPNLFIFVQSFIHSGRFTGSNYLDFFQNASQLEALRNSLLISAASVVLAALIGVPLAFLFHSYEFPGRQLFAALASLPVLLPPLVGVVAFLFLYGESGMITRSLQMLLHLDAPPFSLRGFWAILFVHAYTMYVYFYLFVSAGLKRLDFSLLEAALSLGSSRRRAFFTVTLRMLTPSLAGAALLTFMTSMASFSAPYLFGGGIRVLALQIFNSKLNGDLEMAFVETVILSLASTSFLIFLQRYEGTSKYYSAGKGVQQPVRRLKSKSTQLVMTSAGIALVILLLLPHLALILISFSQNGTWTTEILPPSYTMENYRLLFSGSSIS